MEEYLGEMDCKNRSDSIMMRLLRSAMDKAHRKVQSKDGPIECLHQRSKFYEFAIIQIEGSLKLIQEETDNSRIPEINRENMISGLMELKHSLHSRLKEMKASIISKDRELIELKQALELKENELFKLRSILDQLERTKSGGIQDFAMLIGDQVKDDGDICTLKNSVDQQVLSIKQRLEDERMNFSSVSSLSRRTSYGEGEFEVFDEMPRRNLVFDNYTEIKPLTELLLRQERHIVIEQMSSDIDILKGTLDHAFGRMQNVEARPLEKEWKWGIERECISILLKGFIKDLNQNFQEELINSSNSWLDESALREDLYVVFLREMVKEWKENVEICVGESLLKEELNRIVFDERIKYVKRIENLDVYKAWKFGRETCDFMYSDFVKFDNVLFDFEHTVHKTLQRNHRRYYFITGFYLIDFFLKYKRKPCFGLIDDGLRTNSD